MKNVNGNDNMVLRTNHRVPSFKRWQCIFLPKWSNDTRVCDDLDNMKECDLHEGYSACFSCIESRYSQRVCFYFAKNTPILNTTTDKIVIIPANESNLRSYCVRTKLRDLLNNEKSDDNATDLKITNERK